MGTPYVGVRGGLTKLKDVRATVNNTQLQGAGSTFEYGLVAGLSFGKPQHGCAVFVGEAWTWRKFEGVTWTGGAVPPVLQAPLRLYTRTTSVVGRYTWERRVSEGKVGYQWRRKTTRGCRWCISFEPL